MSVTADFEVFGRRHLASMCFWSLVLMVGGRVTWSLTDRVRASGGSGLQDVAVVVGWEPWEYERRGYFEVFGRRHLGNPTLGSEIATSRPSHRSLTSRFRPCGEGAGYCRSIESVHYLNAAVTPFRAEIVALTRR